MMNTGTLKIAAHGDREIVMTRVFDAPRNLVFDAFTKPELVKRWLLGPPGWTMPVCEIDLKVGGAYRYFWRQSDGTEMGMRGVYREIIPPERVVPVQIDPHIPLTRPSPRRRGEGIRGVAETLHRLVNPVPIRI